MRNLKRALSLALASVMVMGLMVVGAGASYADVSSEENQEAIEVLQAVGVMTGDENGNFNPDALVTRNEMAVVMSNLMDYRVASYKGTSPFTDVPSWAEPYVAACYTNGITSGMSATTYGGDQSVTTAQAALMLMKALGYFQYQSDFEDDWQFATIKQAGKIELFDDVESGVREAMTRNDLAQLVLNTLESGMVEADDDTIKVNTDGVSVEAGKVTYNYVTSSKPYARAISSVTPAGATAEVSTSGCIVELGEKLYDGDLKKTPNTNDAFGRPATRWAYKTENVGTYGETPDAVYTAKMSKDNLYDLLGKDVIKNYTLNLYTDGVPTTTGSGEDETSDLAITTTYALSGSSTASCGSGKGVRTEVYIDSDAELVTIAVINTYVMQATADFNEKKGSLNVDTLTKPDSMSNTSSLSENDFELADFEDEDYILYTASSTNGVKWSIESIAPAEVVEGTVDAYSVENYVTIDGTKLEYAAKIEGAKKGDTPAEKSAATEYVVGDTAAVVTDAYGYVIYVDDASISTGNYVYIAKTAQQSSLSTKDIADAYFADGINEEIVLKSVKDKDGDPVEVPDGPKTDLAGWYSYSKNSSGEYTLKAAATSTKGATDTQSEASPSKSVVVVYNSTAVFAEGMGIKGNASTTFIVKDKDDDITVYTGIANLPEISVSSDDATIGVSYMKSKDDPDNAASLVFIDASKGNIKNAATDSVIYTLKKDSTYVDNTDNETVHTWIVIMDGQETKIDTKETWTTKTFYEDYSVDADGYYEAGSSFDVSDPDKDIINLTGDSTMAYSDGTLRIGRKNLVISDTEIVLVMIPASKGSGDLSTVIMADDNADYEISTPSAKSLASLFEDYYLTGRAFVTYDDADKNDLVNTIYVEITAATPKT